MASRTMSLPIPVPSDFIQVQDGHRYPHVHAQLVAISRQSKPDLDDAAEDPKISSGMLSTVVSLLDQEREDELKRMLREVFDIQNALILEQHILDLMHKHRDDSAGVPFLFLTPTKRPISRPNSRPSSPSIRFHQARPDTPTSAPSSPLVHLFKRPHTPTVSPLASTHQATSYMSVQPSYSPSNSPTLHHLTSAYVRNQYTSSLPASPLSSPRLLNAKAHEFKPIQRPLSAASSHPGGRTETPSPDMWSHSPFRASNLAIAAPLLAEKPLLGRSSSLQYSRGPYQSDEDDDDDDMYQHFQPSGADHEAQPYLPSIADYDVPWSNSSNIPHSPDDFFSLDPHGNNVPYFNIAQFDITEPPPLPSQRSYTDAGRETPPNPEADNDILTDGMTPFDVLSSVFGSTLAPSELEEALAANSYDFERSMAWLVDRSMAAASPPTNPARGSLAGSRMTVVGRDNQGQRGGPAGFNGTVSGNGRGAGGKPGQSGNRVCRYFVAGECLRADCRFSHDLERALCRFWLRGACAKNESCEFLHHLPKDVDVTSLSAAMNKVNITTPPAPVVPNDDFPVLGTAVGPNGIRVYDPRTARFANAVKKSVAPSPIDAQAAAARREAMGISVDNLHSQLAIVAPKASPRLQLRPPSLLPTIPTGDSVNSMYMAYRSRALQLGGARNACLSRAADAWRRGDGAAAKRFSREGHDLNSKMSTEMASASAKLVRERAKIAEQAVKGRDTNWSNDPADRTARGKLCGAGLGVILGVASTEVGNGKLSTGERTEAALDLHGLHSNEATEVLEQFLLALEKEHFYGLAYIIVGDERHVGKQDPARGASRFRLAKGVREWIHRWSYPWNERETGVICVDPLTHSSE